MCFFNMFLLPQEVFIEAELEVPRLTWLGVRAATWSTSLQTCLPLGFFLNIPEPQFFSVCKMGTVVIMQLLHGMDHTGGAC